VIIHFVGVEEDKVKLAFDSLKTGTLKVSRLKAVLLKPAAVKDLRIGCWAFDHLDSILSPKFLEDISGEIDVFLSEFKSYNFRSIIFCAFIPRKRRETRVGAELED
jgi:hypothetical protein